MDGADKPAVATW